MHNEEIIELVPPELLTAWLEGIKEKKRPSKCDIPTARALLILVYYTGARPGEIVELKPKDITQKNYVVPKRKHQKKVYEVTLTTLKKGDKVRVLPIPVNEHTTEMFTTVKKQYPEMRIFHAFYTNAKNPVNWKQKKQMLVKENQEVKLEAFTLNKHKDYIKTSFKIYWYIKQWTGLPPYYFRHNRFSFMADKGASDRDIQYYKGSKSAKSVAPYRHLSTQAKEKLTEYF